MPLSSSHNQAFFVTCLRNTEGLLLDELRLLGAADATETRGGVAFTGSLALAYRVCLWSRVAGRVLLRLASFAAEGPDDLYAAANKLPWEDHMSVTGTLAVEVTSAVSRGPFAQVNTHFVEQRVKDAVVDRFRAKTGSRPGVDLARPDIRINLHIAPAEAVVSLDLSGDSLHRRGYRMEGGGAPLKENLAAAILLRAGWPGIAAAGGALVDPMCGSGTLLVEGAFMAADIAPGLLREYFGFLRWKGFEPAEWVDLIREAEERRAHGLKTLPPIVGFDLDNKAVGTARANARRAGLAGRVSLEQRGLAALTGLVRPAAQGRPAPTGIPGLLVANPPYGKRLGDALELVETYETLGQKLKEHFSGWEAAIFTGNPDLGAHLGLRAHRVNVLFNGPLECRLLLFHIGDPRGIDGQATRLHAGADEPLGESALMFANRLRKNLKHLRSWAARENIQCYRVYDADLPEYAVAVDLYGDRAHVQEYAPPGTVDPVRARRRLKEAVAAVPGVLGIPPSHVVVKIRRPQRGPEQYQKLSDEGRLFEVAESDLRFLVNLTDYLDTGLFLDHRITRSLIREMASGRRFLNLFAYTGSASVYAAAGGATATTTIDLSPTYLDWARRNMALNGFTGPEHSYARADCVEWLAAAAARRAASATDGYGLIFLDAPTFSNSKSMSDSLDIQDDHPALIRPAVSLLSPSGALLFSTNSRRFKLDPELSEEFAVTDISAQTIPPDFARNPRIHKCYLIHGR